LTRGRNQGALKGDRDQVVDEPHAVAQQNRHEVDHDLVEEAGAQALHGEVGPKDDDILAVCCGGGRRDSIAQLSERKVIAGW
jgi:hypothetical protein